MKYKIKGLDIEITEEQLIELNKQRENKGEKYFFPEIGEEYYILDQDGEVHATEYYMTYDKEVVERGNAFRTEELAKKEDEKRKAIVRLWKYVQDNNLFFEPDWSDDSQCKYFPYYDHDDKKWLSDSNCAHQINFLFPYFKTEKDNKKFIDNNLSDLNLFL